MSKIREQFTAPPATPLAVSPTADLAPYVVFTQLKKDGPYLYAGWLEAADHAMAILLAKEHYGQDQFCTAIWAAPRECIGGLRENLALEAETSSQQREYQIFTQQNAGDQHVSSIRIAAGSAAQAIETAHQQLEGAATLHNLWAIPVDCLIRTSPGELIWKFSDQSYRMARGYSKDVRDKWARIRADRDLREYEKDDLRETF